MGKKEKPQPYLRVKMPETRVRGHKTAQNLKGEILAVRELQE
jgi:hypothetical protein